MRRYVQTATPRRRLPHAAGFDGPRAAFAQLWPRPHRATPGSWLIPANHQSISATGINSLTSLFTQSDRHEEDQTGRTDKTKKKASR
jgi:hypothetical protein